MSETQMDPEVTAMAAIVGAVNHLTEEQRKHIARWTLPTEDADLRDLAASTKAFQSVIDALQDLSDPTQRERVEEWTTARFAPKTKRGPRAQNDSPAPKPQGENRTGTIRKVGVA